MSDYKRAYCYLCRDWMVVCKSCGNNSCNGGYGKLKDGRICPDCEKAYQLMMNPDLMMKLDKWVGVT